MTLEPGVSLLQQCKMIRSRYSTEANGYELLLKHLVDVDMPAQAQVQVENYKATIQNHVGGKGSTKTFLYESPEVIENKYQAFNFKVEKPIFDRKLRDQMAMNGVRSQPDLYKRLELDIPLKMKQLTKPKRADKYNVVTGNEFMRRDLGIEAYSRPNHGTHFDYSKFDEQLKNFQKFEITKIKQAEQPKGKAVF